MYDLAADQRRKIANQRNIQELTQKTEDIERFCVLLGGILATIRSGNRDTIEYLVHKIRNRTGLPELAIYVDSIMTTWPEVYEEFERVDFYLDDSPRQPSADDSGSKPDHSLHKRTESRSIDGIMIDGESGTSGEPSRISSNEQSRSSAEESERRESMTDGVMSDRDHAMSDGPDACGHEIAKRHESMGSASDGSASAKSYRPPRPWELP